MHNLNEGILCKNNIHTLQHIININIKKNVYLSNYGKFSVRNKQQEKGNLFVTTLPGLL